MPLVREGAGADGALSRSPHAHMLAPVQQAATAAGAFSEPQQEGADGAWHAPVAAVCCAWKADGQFALSSVSG